MKKFLFVLTATLFCCAMAYAEDDLTLDTMVVTSQKVEEKAVDVPISMSVFSEVDIEDRLIDDVSEISKYTPGLYSINSGSSAKTGASMRGFASDHYTGSSVGLYVDGVPLVDLGSFDEVFMDVERIEVLRGPQGTLYGKNTEVGVVNVITRKPDNNLRGMVRVRAGEDNKKEVGFITSGPIVKDRLYISVSGKHYEKDGYITNSNTGDPANNREHSYGKVYLRWTPTTKLDSSLIVSRIKHNDGIPSVDYLSSNDREVSNDLNGFVKPESLSASLKFDYELNDNVELSSLTVRRHYEEDNESDWDFSDNYDRRSHSYTKRENDTLAQEFKANLHYDRFKLVSGVYLEKKDFSGRIRSDHFRGLRLTNTTEDQKSIGIFSHLTYNLTKKFSVIGGLRYDKDKREFENVITGQTIENDWTEISPKFGLKYKPAEEMTTYATFSKGYRAGGFNTSYDVPETFDKEMLYSYEIGVKGSAMQKRMLYDFAVYYMDITDMQVGIATEEGRRYKGNAAEATSKGFETSVTAKVSRNLKLFSGFSYNDTTYDKYKDASGDYSGNDTISAPDYNFNVGFVYRTDKGYYASFDVTGYGERYMDRKNDYKLDPYQLFNGKVGYETENFEIYLYGKNIFDKEYDFEGEYDGFYTVYSDPREVGVEIAYRF